MQHRRKATLLLAVLGGVICQSLALAVESAEAEEDDPNVEWDHGETIISDLKKVEGTSDHTVADMDEDFKATKEGQMLLELASEGKLYKQEDQHWELFEGAAEEKEANTEVEFAEPTAEEHAELARGHAHYDWHLQQLHGEHQARHAAKSKTSNDELLETQEHAKIKMVEQKLEKIGNQVKEAMNGCQAKPQSPGCLAGNADECRWPEPKKFDLVISWWTNKPQSDLKVHDPMPASLIQQLEKVGVKTESENARFENQAEIKYAMRSFEKHGLLDHVNNVFLLIDSATLNNFGAPRFFNYSNKALHIVTEQDLGIKDTTGGQWRKLLNLDSIPGISDYFLQLPDDNFMVKPFKMEYLYDSTAGKPMLHSYGTFSLGFCDNMPAIGSMHGPVLMNKCAYEVVANNYWRLLRGGGMTSKTAVDVPCLYSNTMRSQWKWKGQNRDFHRECHTNAIGGCNPFSDKEAPLFLNVQGYGVSDEYPEKAEDPKKESWGVKKLMPNGPQAWFHEQFPTKSRFEL